MSLSLLLISSLHDVINRKKILCCDLYSDNIIRNSQKHKLCWWVTNGKKAHFHESLSSWLQGCFGFWTKVSLPKGRWVILFSSQSSPVTQVFHLWSSNQNTLSLLLLFTLSESKKPESCCTIYQQRCIRNLRWQNKSLILKRACLESVLPPRGRDSLKSPSDASQVLPSPPHTRHRSSLASELKMLSQPTCFEVNKQSQRMRVSVVLIDCWNI